MTKAELAKDYLKKGWFVGLTADQIKQEIKDLELETLRADKRTHNGKMIKIFNDAKVDIAKIILAAQCTITVEQ